MDNAGKAVPVVKMRHTCMSPILYSTAIGVEEVSTLFKHSGNPWCWLSLWEFVNRCMSSDDIQVNSELRLYKSQSQSVPFYLLVHKFFKEILDFHLNQIVDFVSVFFCLFVSFLSLYPNIFLFLLFVFLGCVCVCYYWICFKCEDGPWTCLWL